MSLGRRKACFLFIILIKFTIVVSLEDEIEDYLYDEHHEKIKYHAGNEEFEPVVDKEEIESESRDEEESEEYDYYEYYDEDTNKKQHFLEIIAEVIGKEPNYRKFSDDNKYTSPKTNMLSHTDPDL